MRGREFQFICFLFIICLPLFAFELCQNCINYKRFYFQKYLNEKEFIISKNIFFICNCVFVQFCRLHSAWYCISNFEKTTFTKMDKDRKKILKGKPNFYCLSNFDILSIVIDTIVCGFLANIDPPLLKCLTPCLEIRIFYFLQNFKFSCDQNFGFEISLTVFFSVLIK